MKLWGLDISIENARGSVRRWFDPHGKETGSTKMHHHYGYIWNTEGTDGDHVDVYIGPDTTSEKVFIIDQMKKPRGSSPGDGLDWMLFDEQKVMLGFKSAEEAKAAYMKQYNDPRFFGSMKEMAMEDFKSKVLDKANHGKKVAKILHTREGAVFGGAAADSSVGIKEAVSADWIRKRLLDKAPSGIGSAAKATRARYDAAFDAAAKAKTSPKRVAQLGALNEGLRLAGRAERMKAAGISKKDLTTPHDSARGLPGSQVRKGIAVEKEHTDKPSIAKQIAIDHLRERPDYYTKLDKMEKAARLTAELNMAKASKGEELTRSRPVLGEDHAGISALPGTSAFARATQTAEDVEAAEAEIKAAALSERAQHISDRIDDAGLAVLAAPYAASAAGHRLSKARNPKIRAAGLALEKGLGTDSKFGKSHGREIAGLAMVAPGVTHRAAKAIDDRTKKAQLEKIAQLLYPDWEYMTTEEQEKISNVLANMAGRVARGVVGKAVQTAKHMGQGARQLGRDFVEEGTRAVKGFGHNIGDLRAGSSAARKAQFRAGLQGQSTQVANASASRASEKAMRNRAIARGEVTTGTVGQQLAQRDVVRAQRAAQNAQAPAPSLGDRLQAHKAQKAKMAPVAATTAPAAAGVPAPTNAPGATGAAGVAAKKLLVTPGNLAKAGVIGVGGLGLYGAYKGIQTVGNMLQHHHETPLAPPGYAGVGRTF